MFNPDKRRITEQLLAYWDGLRGGKKWPAVQKVSRTDIPVLWEDILVVRVKEEGELLTFESVHRGRNIAAMIENADLALKEGLEQQLEAVYRARGYLQDEEVYTNRKGFRIRYRRIILPFGPDNTRVDHLLCGMRHKVEDRGADMPSP